MKFICTIVTLLLFTFNLMAADGSLEIDVKITGTSFKVKADQIRGKRFQKDGKYYAPKLWVNIKDLSDSSMEMRTEHMRERLIYKDYPEKKGKKFRKIFVKDVVAQNGKGTGKITIRGITKSFNFKYTKKGENLVAQFPLSLKDFKVPKLSYLVVEVKDQILVTVTLPVPSSK